MIYITRKSSFCAAHRLFNENKTPEENFSIFGKCSNYHGHNYHLTVTVKGEINPETGFVIDFQLLDAIIQELIIQKIDHTILNQWDLLAGKLPSTENIVVLFWKILAPEIAKKGAVLHTIHLQETDKNAVEYFGQ